MTGTSAHWTARCSTVVPSSAVASALWFSDVALGRRSADVGEATLMTREMAAVSPLRKTSYSRKRRTDCSILAGACAETVLERREGLAASAAGGLEAEDGGVLVSDLTEAPSDELLVLMS